MSTIEELISKVEEYTDKNAIKSATLSLEQAEERYQTSGMKDFSYGTKEFIVGQDENGNAVYEVMEDNQPQRVSREKVLQIMIGESDPDVLRGSELGNAHIDFPGGTLYGREIYDKENDRLTPMFTWIGNDGHIYEYRTDEERASIESFLSEMEKAGVTADISLHYGTGQDTLSTELETEAVPNGGENNPVTDPMHDIKAVAEDNYRHAERIAQLKADSVLSYMVFVNNGESIDQVIGNASFSSGRTGDGTLYFTYKEGEDYVPVSKYEMRNRLTGALMAETRRERDRDADAVIYSEAGMLLVNKEKDPRTGNEDYKYSWRMWDGKEYSVPEESMAEYVRSNGWDKEYIREHTVRNSRVGEARHENEERLRERPRNTEEKTTETTQKRVGNAALLGQIAIEHFREVSAKASKYAAQNLSYMERSCDPGNSVVMNVGDTPYLVQKDDRGLVRYFEGDERKERSRDEMLKLIEAGQREKARTEMNRHIDVALGTSEGVIVGTVVEGKDREPSVTFKLVNGAEERPISDDGINRLTENMSDKDILENNRDSVTRAWNDFTDLRALKNHQQKDSNFIENGKYTVPDEIGAKSNDFIVRQAAKENTQPKRALREALKIAEKNNNDINREVTTRMKGVLERMEAECPAGGERSIKIDDHVYTVSRDEDGKLHYRSDNPEPGQEYDRNQMRKAMFLAEKREVVEELKDNGHDELAIVPLNDKQMLIIRSADLERADANAFEDGNKDYNFYLKGEDGREVQLTQKQVNRVFKENGIENEKDIRDRTTTSYDKAKDIMAGLGKAAGRTAAREVKKGLEFATIRQISEGLKEDWARI